MRNNITLLLILLSQFVLSQNIRHNELLSNFEIYKSNESDCDSISQLRLNTLIQKWRLQTQSENEIIRALYKASEGKVAYQLNYADIAEQSIKRNTTNYILEELTNQDSIILGSKFNLFELAANKFITLEYPYETDTEEIIEEIIDYDIQPNEVIAEIGAGLGLHSLIIGLSNKSTKLYANELSGYKYRHLKRKFNDERLKALGVNVIPIKGSENKTNIPEKVDKIILKNTFHHFTKMRKMLRSLRKTIKDDGLIFIYENKTEETECKEALEKEEILNILKKNRLKIIEARDLGKVNLFICKK